MITKTPNIPFRPSIVTKLETMGLYTWPKTRSGKWVLNSQIVRIGFTPTPSTFTEPFEITFIHIEVGIDNDRLVTISPPTTWPSDECYFLRISYSVPAVFSITNRFRFQIFSSINSLRTICIV